MKETPILFTPEHIRAILDDKKMQTRRVLMVPHKNDDGKIVMEQPSSGQDHGVFRNGQWELWGKLNEDGRGLLYEWGFTCPYGVPGDRLWVRERYRHSFKGNTPDACHYLADAGTSRWLQACSREHALESWLGSFKSAMFMPKWAARLWLEITDVRVERVQEVSEKDALAEGVVPNKMTEQDIADIQISDCSPSIKELARAMGPGEFTAKFNYQMLWDDINAKRKGGVFAWRMNPFVWAITFKRIEV